MPSRAVPSSNASRLMVRIELDSNIVERAI